MKMKKKLIALLSMATALMIAMSTTVAATDSLGNINADDEAAIVPRLGPASTIYIEDPVVEGYAIEGVFLESIPEDDWVSLDTTADMMTGAEQLLVQRIAVGEIDALPVDAELLENTTLELTSVGGIDLASLLENSEDVVEEFVMVPAEDLGLTETEFLELALQQLRLVNKDPDGDFPKWAVVYGTQTVTGWQEEPEDSGNWYYYMQNGEKTTGWKNILDGGSYYWFYFFEDNNDETRNGLMAKGIIYIEETDEVEGRYYHFQQSGRMSHGWYNLRIVDAPDNAPIDDGVYSYYRHFGVPGSPSTGFMQIERWIEDVDGKWYYLGEYGRMAANEWKKSGDDWYFLVPEGYMASDVILYIQSKYYYFDADGVMFPGGWFTYNDNTYYATHADGSLATGIYHWGSNYYVYSEFDEYGIWQRDFLKDKSPYIYDCITNVRWDHTKLEVRDGKRVPVLTVSIADVFTSWQDSIADAVNLYNNSTLGVQLQLVDTESADIVLHKQSYYDGDRTAVTTVMHNGVDIAENDKEFITSAQIDFNWMCSANDILGVWVFAHEIGHALGLRHTYEVSTADDSADYDATEDPGTAALMHPFEAYSNWNNTFQEYDYDQFEYTYPS